MFQEIARHEYSKVQRRAATFTEPVVAIGIRHVIELLSELDEAIHQSFGNLNMRIGFACAMKDQQVSLEAFGKIDGRGLLVSVRIRLPCLHVDFLEPRIVEMRLRFGRHGDPHVIDIGLAEHRVESVRATAAPTPDADPGQVDVRPGAAQFLQTRRLLGGGEWAKAAKD